MKKRIPHIIEDGIEKKRCSACKEYKELSEFNRKKDRYDRLSNECIRCLSIRNKRRCDPEFDFPDYVQTREEIEDYLDKCRYQTKRRVEERKIKEKEKEEKWDSDSEKE